MITAYENQPTLIKDLEAAAIGCQSAEMRFRFRCYRNPKIAPTSKLVIMPGWS
jgi:hypothetical protein